VQLKERKTMNHNRDGNHAFIAATIWDGEPRYMATTVDGGAFDYLKIVRGYGVATAVGG
jgi:hypothetical protein